jgi:Leucine-rich repeat (LRR) protein
MSAIHTPCTADVCHPAVISKSSEKRWIPADLVQNTAEYLGSVASLVSFRGVSSMWQGAVSDAVGFLNGRCWTQLEEKRDGPLWRSLCLDRPTTVARCALLCLGRRLETLTLWYVADQLDFPLQLLGENNMVLTTLSLAEYRYCEYTAVVSRLQSCRALKQLDLRNSSVTTAGIRGLELIPTLEILNLGGCGIITDLRSLQNCRALKQLGLARTNVSYMDIRGLELIPTLEILNLEGCKHIKDVSCLRSCRALKELVLADTNVTDAGIRGLELIATLEELDLRGCKTITDVSCLQSCRALKKLFLARTNVTDAGINGLEPTLMVRY